MRSKARGLAQHGGQSGWLEKNDPAGVILYVWMGHTACLFCNVPDSLTGANLLRADGISS